MDRVKVNAFKAKNNILKISRKEGHLKSKVLVLCYLILKMLNLRKTENIMLILLKIKVNE